MPLHRHRLLLNLMRSPVCIFSSQDPVMFSYLDGAALFGGASYISIPAPGSAMGAVPGWPAEYPAIEGAIVQTDAPVNAKGAYDGVKLATQHCHS